jgi:hypothetical protein
LSLDHLKTTPRCLGIVFRSLENHPKMPWDCL